jgi:hypothetical protein
VNRNAQQRKNARDFGKKFIRFVKEMVGSCWDCREPFPPELLTFDHCQGVKRFDMSGLSKQRLGISAIMDEMRKCRVVCRPCHDKREKRREKWPDTAWKHYNRLFGGNGGN